MNALFKQTEKCIECHQTLPLCKGAATPDYGLDVMHIQCTSQCPCEWVVWCCHPFARRKGLVTLYYVSLYQRNAIRWGYMCWHASTYTCWQSWLFYPCHTCGHGYEQQEELHVCASPTEWKSSEFHSFADLQFACYFVWS